MAAHGRVPRYGGEGHGLLCENGAAPMKGRDIVVIGTSAGGLEAVGELIAQLPSDLPAAIFVVQHLAPDLSGVALLRRLAPYKSFGARFARDGEAIKHGQLYLAPPDFHMLVR